MATTYGTTETAATGSRDWDMTVWYDSKFYKFGLLLMLSVATFWIWFQRTYAYSH
ncbi:MAG: methane monooxygenase/ammonia monooxygenase subunit C, partial [Proteobacteria bacterium]|nr:methane monooxygenase/ammonia monooxygenase subunit C [Pseudomonadota bacterium]